MEFAGLIPARAKRAVEIAVVAKAHETRVIEIGNPDSIPRVDRDAERIAEAAAATKVVALAGRAPFAEKASTARELVDPGVAFGHDVQVVGAVDGDAGRFFQRGAPSITDDRKKV